MNKKKLMTNGIAGVALLTVGAIVLQFIGLEYGLVVGYGLAFAHKKVADLVVSKL